MDEEEKKLIGLANLRIKKVKKENELFNGKCANKLERLRFEQTTEQTIGRVEGTHLQTLF